VIEVLVILKYQTVLYATVLQPVKMMIRENCSIWHFIDKLCVMSS